MEAVGELVVGLVVELMVELVVVHESCGGYELEVEAVVEGVVVEAVVVVFLEEEEEIRPLVKTRAVQPALCIYCKIILQLIVFLALNDTIKQMKAV